ncbi:hypothetical protein V500_08769 [Pseudogymnoascus sp. VKM F-4518 (FW-2643)]|nr:hypothetical protein V500_08769 [Pseudogymnoascus sp. VKM F-4518 (FW-2643)]
MSSSSRDHDEGTTEVDPRYLETVTYHNREFQQHSVENSIYFSPIDEDEIERLTRQHRLLSIVFDERLVFPPVNNPRRILDCGHGSASWAVDVAEQYPRCEVYGVDISSHMQPDEIPVNLHLQVDDLNRRFTFARNSFDIVHSQLVAGGINAARWTTYLRDLFRVTRPGGWCQMVEVYYQVQSYNGTLTDEHGLRQWSTRMFQSMEGLKDLRMPLHLANAMRTAGFVDIDHRMIPLPTCAWSEDERERRIGAENRDNVQSFLSSLAIYPLSMLLCSNRRLTESAVNTTPTAERLGMTPNDVQLLIAHARNEADHPAFKSTKAASTIDVLLSAQNLWHREGDGDVYENQVDENAAKSASLFTNTREGSREAQQRLDTGINRWSTVVASYDGALTKQKR